MPPAKTSKVASRSVDGDTVWRSPPTSHASPTTMSLFGNTGGGSGGSLFGSANNSNTGGNASGNTTGGSIFGGGSAFGGAFARLFVIHASNCVKHRNRQPACLVAQPPRQLEADCSVEDRRHPPRQQLRATLEEATYLEGVRHLQPVVDCLELSLLLKMPQLQPNLRDQVRAKHPYNCPL